MFNLVAFFLLKYLVAQMLYGVVYQQVTLCHTACLKNILLASVYISKTWFILIRVLVFPAQRIKPLGSLYTREISVLSQCQLCKHVFSELPVSKYFGSSSVIAINKEKKYVNCADIKTIPGPGWGHQRIVLLWRTQFLSSLFILNALVAHIAVSFAALALLNQCLSSGACCRNMHPSVSIHP